MTMSLTAAWAPVPLTGQSSSTWPASRSASPARSLSSMAKVEVSTIVRAGTSALVIAATVASSAPTFGSDRMIVGAAAASVATSGTTSTPARVAARFAGSVDIEAEHAPAGRCEVTGERPAHIAEADDADRTLASFRHLTCASPLLPRRAQANWVSSNLASTFLFPLTEYPPQMPPIRPSQRASDRLWSAPPDMAERRACT